ncbi:MAG TPA: hypothetical protein HA367_08445 [Candidatus Methanofastidiosum sp.]|nr:hypothetical protein [Methanofastidiosum sp.]
MFKFNLKIKNKNKLSPRTIERIFGKILRTLDNEEYFDIIKDDDDNVIGSWEQIEDKKVVDMDI